MSRKIKIHRKSRRRIKSFFSYIFAVLILSVIILWVLLVLTGTVFKKTLYISPLASVVNSISSKVKDSNQKSLEALLNQNNISFSHISTSSESAYLVYLKKDGEVVFSSKKDFKSQITSLQYILSRLTMEGRSFLRLDLRFEKPVVVLR